MCQIIILPNIIINMAFDLEVGQHVFIRLSSIGKDQKDLRKRVIDGFMGRLVISDKIPRTNIIMVENSKQNALGFFPEQLWVSARE